MHIKRGGLRPVRTLFACAYVHIKKRKGHFDTLNAHFIFAQFLIIVHLSKKGRCDLIQQTDALAMFLDWEVRRLGMRETLNHETITVSGFGYFHKNLPFTVEKKLFQRQIQEVRYTTPIVFVWFQRSCGSMKSVSSDFHRQ